MLFKIFPQRAHIVCITNVILRLVLQQCFVWAIRSFCLYFNFICKIQTQFLDIPGLFPIPWLFPGYSRVMSGFPGNFQFISRFPGYSRGIPWLFLDSWVIPWLFPGDSRVLSGFLVFAIFIHGFPGYARVVPGLFPDSLSIPNLFPESGLFPGDSGFSGYSLVIPDLFPDPLVIPGLFPGYSWISGLLLGYS